MNQIITKGIILTRTDYGEADRIITLLTPDHGKLRLMARGVRKQKSKLAGGIELFSVSTITFIRGRGEIGTLISARLEQHYGNIVKSLDRVQLGYDLTKILNKATEDAAESEYFDLLQQAFVALNDAAIDVNLIRFWFSAQLIQMAGFGPNLQTDAADHKLEAGNVYNFDHDSMTFRPHEAGSYTTDHIKFLRLTFAGNQPQALQKIQNLDALLAATSPLIQTVLQTFIRIN